MTSQILRRLTNTVMLTALVAVAAACGPMEDVDYEPRTITQPIERICGADRYTGPQGVDVSTYQENFDWTARQQEGIEFGIARVSNGTEIIDDYFDRNWREMKNHGILRGAYQYFRPGQSAEAQAQLMVDKLGPLGPGDLPAVIDVETADGQSAATVREKVRTWLQIVEEGTGKRPMIYTAAYFWRDEVGDTGLGDYPLWIANYGAECPLTPEGWDEWTMWQYCDGNPDYCSNGQGFDRDVFNGTSAELEGFAAGGGTYGASVVEQSFPDAEAAVVTMVTGEGPTSVWVELENTGTATWNEQTLLGTTEPRDRQSVFATEDWISPNRAARVEGVVEPGGSHRFEFDLRAPAETGSYVESFGLVQEGEVWFSDQGHGGPADDVIQIAIEVTEDGGPDADEEDSDDETEMTNEEDSDTDSDSSPPTQDAELPRLVGPSPGVGGGCSHTPVRPAWGWVAILGVLFGIGRRRR